MTDTNSKAQVTDAMVEAGYAHSPYPTTRGAIACILTHALAAQEKPEPGVAVKALIWNGAVADCAFGRYTVSDDTDDEWSFTFHCYPYGEPSGSYPDEIAAKAAAQSDYEQRIRSALVSTQAQAPAAWIGKDALERLEAIHEMRAGFIAAEICNSEWGDRFNVPLYLHPAPSPDLPEGEVETTEAEKLRSALRAAVDTIQDYLAYQHDGDPWSEDSRTMGEMDINDYARDGRLDYALALLPSPSPIDKGEVK